MKINRHPPQDYSKFAPQETMDRLSRIHGEGWEVNSKGIICHINPDWWAALIHGESHLLHDPEEHRFYGWDEYEGIYLPVSDDMISYNVSRRLKVAAEELDHPELNNFRSMRTRDSIRTILRAVSEVRDPFHHRKPILALKNGVIELENDKLHFRNFDPKYLLNHKAKVKYDPDADCPRFIREFLKPMLSDEDIDLLQRYLGLVLIGQNLINRMGILEGDSAAGKTTLINIIIALLGEDRCCQLRTEHLDKQFELESFRGRQLLMGVDVGATFLNSRGAQTLKGLCSSDLYHPEAKGRIDRRPLRGPFHVIIGTNCSLGYYSQGDGAAWARRLLIFLCKGQKGRKKIPCFDQILIRDEGSGIVNWMIEGLRRALVEIEQCGDLLLTQVQIDRIDQLVLRSEAAHLFVEQCVVADKGSDVTSEEMVQAFYSFCQARDWAPGSEQVFLQKVAMLIADRFSRPKANDLERNGKKTRRGWRGIALKDEGWREAEGM